MQRDRRRRPGRRRLLRAGGVLIVLGAAAAGAFDLAAAGRSAADVDPFATTPMRAFLRGRVGNISAALYNIRTGATFLYRPGVREQTASIVKVDILATLLHEAQDHDASLGGEEQYLAAGMIEQSSDEDATDLWADAGGTGAIGAFDRSIGMTQTTPDAQGYWGESLTTARDQIRLLRVVALPNDVLHYNWRASELYLMAHVIPFDEWGVSAGPPANVSVALKNGWVPVVADDWQVNSIGAVAGDGRDYLLAVLTSGDAGKSYGVETIDGISRIIWSALKPARSTTATGASGASA
jgi:hypothetical protein